MKTLDQVQPRTPIDSTHTPGDSSSQFIITTSGSYYLTANVSGTSSKNGIAIAADNVTLDLNGFSLLGAGGSLAGAVVSGTRQNIVIYNGTARGWGGNGIDAGNASNAQLTQLQVSGNGAAGLVAGSSSIVRGCIASGNTGDGIRVTGMATRVEDNNCASNGGAGIRVDAPGNLVIKNNATTNGTDYNIVAGTSYGQIVQTPGANFTSGTAWSNFSSSCPAGQVFCSGVCANLSNSPTNCGTCGNTCTVANGTPGCTSGNCVVASCNSGFADCNNNPADGCETNTGSNVNNCGACGVVCAPVNRGTPACTGGVCVIGSCTAGFADCNNTYSDGCETNTANDVNNCGACNNKCVAPNATTTCSGGLCAIAGCNSGFANCNGSYADGCEINVSNNVNNCGTCGHVCFVQNGTPACASGTCVVASCNSGFANCNNNAGDGCEVNLQTDPNNCGTCGTKCASGHACSAGVCQ
jgi:hypothetical protein